MHSNRTHQYLGKQSIKMLYMFSVLSDLSCRLFFCLSFIGFMILPHGNVQAETKTLGWLESAYLHPWGIKLRTKLDTGAKTSSLHAVDVEKFYRQGELWVKFALPYDKKTDKSDQEEIILEKEVQRTVRIKDHDDASEERYVIELEFCLAGKVYSTPFTLSDRSNFHYRMLLGRRTLENRFLVDSAKTFTTKKSCYKED